jgi:hypothetical protein
VTSRPFPLDLCLHSLMMCRLLPSDRCLLPASRVSCYRPSAEVGASCSCRWEDYRAEIVASGCGTGAVLTHSPFEWLASAKATNRARLLALFGPDSGSRSGPLLVKWYVQDYSSPECCA